jgi:hypothetical protein
LKKNEDSAKLGADSEHQKIKDYSTQQQGNLNNSSTLRRTTAYKLSCRALLQQAPPIILCGR